MLRRFLLTAAISVAAAGAASAAESLADTLAQMGAAPCETGALTCVTLDMPLDRSSNDPETIPISFAVSLASGDSKGVLFYLVGGPGGSGLASADDYLSAYDPALTENLDIVFMDQRGTGPVHGLNCPVAQARLDISDVLVDRPDAAMDVARTYVRDCLAELDADRILPHVGTDAAVADMEAFRQAIGAPKVWLYGESYGTQFVQTYATTHPQAVRGAIVDGVVDLNLSTEGFYASYVKASERLLARTFAECRTAPGCADDMQGDPATIYDDLADRLAKAPLPVDMVQADGTRAVRDLTLASLNASAFFSLYSSEAKSSFLRALAAAGRGDLTPILHYGYSSMYIDPQTLAGREDPSWFGAAYFAITCLDYGAGSATAEENARRIMQEAGAFADQAPRLSRYYFLERLICAFWPHQGPDQRPEPFAGGDFPTIVMNGDADPITPIDMAYSVLDSSANSYGIFMRNGPHVIWGRGLGCPDLTLSGLLFDGTLPPSREMQCSQDFIAPYTPLTLREPSAAADPLAVVRAVETELGQSIELGDWWGYEAITLGCNFGGTLTATPTDTSTDYAFKGCAFWPGITIDGTGSLVEADDSGDGMTLDLTVSGAHQGTLSFHHSAPAEAWFLSGTYDGTAVSTSRSYP